MASQIIGRTDCPECNFTGAHVKQSDKCLYRYCPECGSQHMARSKRQEADLMAKTRLVGSTSIATASATDTSGSAQTLEPATAVPVEVAPAVASRPPPAPPAPVRRRGLFA